MANPQPTHHVRISTELFEELCKIRINGEARQVFDFIIRKTYGFHKPKDAISISQFMIGTKLSRWAVCRAKTKLADMKLIGVYQKADSSTATYWVIKDYHKWKVSTKKQISTKKSEGIYQNVTKVSTKKQNTIDKKITTIDKATPLFDFDAVWTDFPNKIGRTAAERSFKSSVKTDKDYEDIKKALHYYLKSERVSKKFIQNGSTWFNNWRDWVDNPDPKKPETYV